MVLALTLVLFALAASGVLADTLVVDRTDDDATATACSGAPGDCSLRGAIIAANGNGVEDTIVFDVDGVFALSIAGANEDAATSGDLDILDDLIFSGNGLSATVIDGGALDRVFDVHPGAGGVIVVAFEDLTIRNGRTPAAGLSFLNSGAGIDFPASHGGSGTLTVRDCHLTGNTTGNANGGAIYVSRAFGQPVPVVQIIDSEIMSSTAHLGGGGVRCDNCDLSVSGSDVSHNDALVTGGIGYGGGGLVVTGTSAKADIRNGAFRGNTSADDGGGILFASGVMTISNSALSGNTAAANGGGISDETSIAGGSLKVADSAFANNSAVSGSGGGIYNDDLNLSVSLSRITGNFAGATGTGIANASGTVDAEDNWWGCDGFPGDTGCDSTSGTVDSDPRIDLALSATPATIPVTGASSVVANVIRNTDGAAIAPTVLDGLDISFAGNAFGSVAPSTVALSGGQAGTTYTGENPGTADVSASLDNGTETTPITVVPGGRACLPLIYRPGSP